MSLYVIFCAMVVATIVVLLFPIARKTKPVPSRKDYDLAVYRDQMAEIEGDIVSGSLPVDQAEVARHEIYKRALISENAEQEPPAHRPERFRLSRIAASIVIIFVLPFSAAAAYLYLGSPTLPAAPYAERKNDPEFILASEIDRLAAYLDKNPDATGYSRLGDGYSVLRRFDGAVEAYRKSLAINPKDAKVWSDLGEALGMAQRGSVTGEARAAFSKALRIDPNQPSARFYLGLAALQDNEPRRAVAIWKDLLKDGSGQAPWIHVVEKQIVEISTKYRLDADTIAPARPVLVAAEDVEAILSLNASDRAVAIRGMVDRLSARLSKNSDDIDGWRRLEKSYRVLGETAKAKDAQNRIEALTAKGLAK